MRKVDIKMAYWWHCPDCDHEHYEKAVVAELSEEEHEECYRAMNQMEDWQELPEDWKNFLLVQSPNIVKCSCGAEFETIDERAME